jgi:hypothetical protein
MTKKSLIYLLAFGLLLFPMSAFADSIDPETFTIEGVVGGPPTLVAIHKTVTVTEGTPTTAKVDIFFLSDTTGSMGPYIANVKANASTVLGLTAGLGDVAWGVGEYKDFPTSPWGGGSDYPYQLNQAITTNQANVQTGINAWSASGGADLPESNLYGLQQASLEPSWRAGSQKLIVQFGDAPGHDPATTAGYPGPTEAVATAAMQAQNIKLLAIDTVAGPSGKDSTGQETRMVAATGGEFFDGIPAGSDIATAIADIIVSSFEEYTTVGLDLSELPECISYIYSGDIVGDFSRETTETFEFDLILALCCKEVGECSFNIYATVDGARVATEVDYARCVPIPGSLILLGSGLLGVLGLRRRS